jgi:hypothetical protein
MSGPPYLVLSETNNMRQTLAKPLIALVTVFLFQSANFAQASDPKNVLDYYLLLPDKYFEANKEQS